MVLIEVADDVTPEAVKAKTEAPFTADLKDTSRVA
jgi:acyl CoA:acetate/3-ketoacid CoA transferase beta subunit